MEIKKRHYRRIPQLVRRDRGDGTSRALDSAAADKLNALYLMEAFPGVGPGHPELIPTADGAIERVLFTIPKYAVEDETMARAYQTLFSKLPSGIRLVVLTQKSCETAVRGWLEEHKLTANAEVNVFEDALNISIWAEDGYVVAKDLDSKSTYFIEPYSFPRYADSLVAEFVVNFTDLKGTRAPLYFQGGNVLIGDKFFLIGADYPANSLKYIASHVLSVPSGTSPKDFIKALYREYLDHDRNIVYVGSRKNVPVEQERETTVNGEKWKEVICAGNGKGTVQPLFHIDMFISLVGQSNGKYKLLVGDPSAADKILGGEPQAHAMQPVFDDIAEQLVGLGFEVGRNPLPLVYMDDPEHKKRMWYFATANNALVQNSPTKKVWLPTYGYGSWKELSKTDEANAQIWHALGFEVHLLSDFHPFAENLGAVHCIKKYLGRGSKAVA
jgi:hypothetical protein